MTIRVSDLGITKYNAANGDSSKVGYVSYNERLNKNPVSKVNSVTSATSKERSVAKETAQDFVSGSTPAYTVGFTSQGLTALKSFKASKAAAETLNKLGDKRKSNEFKTASLKDGNEKKSGFLRSTGDDNKKTTVQNYKNSQAIKAYSYQMDIGEGFSKLRNKDKNK